MDWGEFFSGLLGFIVACIFLDAIFLEGLFANALAKRISGEKDSD